MKIIVKRLTEFRHRDGLSKVVGRCVQNLNNIEKQCRHLRTIGCCEEIEATIDSGAARCVFLRGMCNKVIIRQCAESPRGMMFRTASGQKFAHEGIRTTECSIEYVC